MIVEERLRHQQHRGRPVAKAKPDGYSFSSWPIRTAGSRHLFKDLPFDTVKDFVPAATFAQIVFCIVVAADSKFKTMEDLTNYLKSTDRG